MLKFNLTGSVQEELEKIAVEKGWGPKPGYAQIKEEQIKALQKLLNKKTSGSEDGPLKVDGIWGFNTAGIYHQVKTQNPELNLETLYGNMEPTNKQVLNAIKILFYKQHEGHGKEISDNVKKTVYESLSNTPKAEVPAGSTGKFDPKKLIEERVKYKMEMLHLTEAEARQAVKLEDEAKQPAKLQGILPQKSSSLNINKKAEDTFNWKEPTPNTTTYVKPEGPKPPFEYKEKIPNTTPYVKPEGVKSPDNKVEPAKQKSTKSKAVFDFQTFVQELSPIKIDGVWGQQSNAVWQHICDELGVRLENHSSPTKKPADNVIYSLISKLKGQNADDPGAKNEEAIELASQGVPVEEALKNVASNTISCLVSLADELDSLGEAKVAIAIDNQINFYKKAMDKLYDVTGETGEAFVNSAHTDHVTIAPAKEEGGKIENIVEQQKKDLAIVTKDPVGKYASTIIELVKTANKLDEEGLIEEAAKVDMVIAELQKKFPFANEKLANEASNFFGKKYASETEEFLPIWSQMTSAIYLRLNDIMGPFKRIMGSFDSPKPYEKAKFEKVFNVFDNLYKFYNNILLNKKEYISFSELNNFLSKDKEFLNKYSALSNSELINIFGPSDFGRLSWIINPIKEIDKNIENFIVKFKPHMEKFNSMGPEEQKQYLYGYKEKLSETKKDNSVTKNQTGKIDESKLTETQKIYLKQIKNFIYNLENTKNLLVNNAEAIGSALGKGPEFAGKLADSLVGESEKIKASLNDPNKYEGLYNYVKSFGSSIYNLSKGLSSKFATTNNMKIKTAQLSKEDIEALKQLGDAFSPKGKDKQKPGTPSSPLAKNRSGGGYNKNLPSDEVEKLQKYLGVKIDGKYGPITHEALKNRLSQLGGNISIPVNFNDVRMGNIEQIGDALRQPGSVALVSNKSPEADGATKVPSAPLSKRTYTGIEDPWSEQGVEGVAKDQQVHQQDMLPSDSGEEKVNTEQLKKEFIFNFKKYKNLVFDYNNGFYDSLSKFKYQYPDDYRQELSNKGDDIRKIYRFLKKNESALSNYGVDFGEMYDNLSSMGNKLRMREEEEKVAGV